MFPVASDVVETGVKNLLLLYKLLKYLGDVTHFILDFRNDISVPLKMNTYFSLMYNWMLVLWSFGYEASTTFASKHFK